MIPISFRSWNKALSLCGSAEKGGLVAGMNCLETGVLTAVRSDCTLRGLVARATWPYTNPPVSRLDGGSGAQSPEITNYIKNVVMFD